MFSSQTLLYIVIAAFAMVGVGTLVNRVWHPTGQTAGAPSSATIAPNTRSTANTQPEPASHSPQGRSSAPITEDDPNATLPDNTADVILPPDDGTHYVKAIRLPFTVWDSTHQTIAVYIDPGYTHYAAQVKKAFIAWQQALNYMFAFTFVDTPEQADCAISWANELPHSSEHDRDVYTAGIAHSLENNVFIYKNDIEFRVKDPQQRPITGVSMYNTALHEIGHMLGIKGHSDQPGDIMAAVSDNTNAVRLITHRDVNTLRTLYQGQIQAPRILTPPNVRLAKFRRHMDLLEQAENPQLPLATALGLARQANELYSNNPQAHLCMASLLRRLNQPSQAKALLLPWMDQPTSLHNAIYSEFVLAQIMQTKTYAESNQPQRAKAEAQTTLPKLARALKLPDLDADMRQYFLQMQPIMQDMADFNA